MNTHVAAATWHLVAGKTVALGTARASAETLSQRSWCPSSKFDIVLESRGVVFNNTALPAPPNNSYRPSDCARPGP